MKKIISSVPALGLAFGAAAYLPESITPQSGITAQAASSVKTFGFGMFSLDVDESKWNDVCTHTSNSVVGMWEYISADTKEPAGNA